MTKDTNQYECRNLTYFSLFHKFSVQFSRSVVSNSLRPHELQHARPPCPSPTPGVHSNSCPSSQWCHPAISSSVIPFSSCPQSLPASGSFPMSQLFAWGGQSIGVSTSASVLPMNTQDWSPLEGTSWISLQSKGLTSLLQHHSSKASILRHSAFFSSKPSSLTYCVTLNKCFNFLVPRCSHLFLFVINTGNYLTKFCGGRKKSICV